MIGNEQEWPGTTGNDPAVSPKELLEPPASPIDVEVAAAKQEAARPYTPHRPDIHKFAPNRDERLFLVLSIFIGVISGLLAVCFRVSINWFQVLTLGSAPRPGQLRLLIVPMVAGAVVGALVQIVFPLARGSGVNQTKAALYIFDGFISFKTVIGKFITAAMAIGGGFSLGPEDPSLQIGAGVASMISRRLRLSRERLRLFAPIGAAAGLAAAFNAPISAILFVVEEVIGRWSAAVLGSIVLAAFSSVVVARWFGGPEPLFRIPAITPLKDPRELIAYAVLGVVGGVAALIFSKALGYLRPWLRSLPRWTRYCQPPLAGLMVGAIGYFGAPQVMGAGYGAIDQAMHGQFTWKFLLILGLLKILATTLSFSSGTPGGMFAPTLFAGAMLGASVGTFEKLLFPHLSIPVAGYATVGMGVLFAGFLRAPLTSVFMAMELSGNYSIVLPVILANTIAYLISRSFQHVPIFETLTVQDGLDLPSMEEQREESILHLEDALLPVNIPVVAGRDSVGKVASSLAPDTTAFLIKLWDGSWYSMTREELTAIAALCTPETLLDTMLKPDRTPTLFPDLPLDSAIPYLARWPVLPIHNRAARGTLNGIVTFNDVIQRYQNRVG